MRHFFSFTLYPTKLNRGYLVLRHFLAFRLSCLLSGETRRRRCQGEENINETIDLPQMGIEPTNRLIYSQVSAKCHYISFYCTWCLDVQATRQYVVNARAAMPISAHPYARAPASTWNIGSL